jgi:hypothetical protein
MNKTIKVTMTPKLVRQAYLAQCGLDLIFIFSILAVCGLQAYVVWDYCGCMSASWLWYFLAYMVIPVGFACSYGYAYFKTVRMIKDMKSPIIKYNFTDKWLQVDSTISKSKNAWVAFRGIRKSPEVWQIFMSNNSFLILPVASLDEKVKKFLTIKLPQSHRTTGWYAKMAFFLFAFFYIAYSFIQWFAQLDGNH